MTTRIVNKKSKKLEIPTTKKPATPLGFATWLVQETSLTFEQIADFCGIHSMDVFSLGGSSSNTVKPISPIGSYLAKEELERCEQDPSARLQSIVGVAESYGVASHSKRKYVPSSQKKGMLDATLWLVQFRPNLKDSEISNLTGVSVGTVAKIKDGSYRGMDKLVPKNPSILGLCSASDIGLSPRAVFMNEESQVEDVLFDKQKEE